LLVVPRKAAALHTAGIGPLDDPSTADDDATLHRGHAPDDLQRDVGLAPRPYDEAPGVGAIREHGLHEGKRPAGPLQHALGAVAILDVGGVDLDREQSAVGVGQGEAASATGSSGRLNALAPMDLPSVGGAYAAPPEPRSSLTMACEPPF
jgi:hypothetical protein